MEIETHELIWFISNVGNKIYKIEKCWCWKCVKEATTDGIIIESEEKAIWHHARQQCSVYFRYSITPFDPKQIPKPSPSLAYRKFKYFLLSLF